MHNIEHYSYPENADKKAVQKELDNYVAHEDWQEGCQGLLRDIRWLGDKVYPNRIEAERAIEKLDRGNYDQIAVKYYCTRPFTNAKKQELDRKRNEAIDEEHRRDSKIYPKTLTSAFLGCKECGSRLAVKWLGSNFCPVCKNDLRPEYILKGIKTAQARVDSANKKLSEYIDKHAKKEIYWLVKIEYHT